MSDDRPDVTASGGRSSAAGVHSGITQTGDGSAATQNIFAASLPHPEDVSVRGGLNTLPRRPTKVFVGRDDALRQLREALSDESSNVVVTQALHGLGGVGKTELALHYAVACRDTYGLVGWITADSPDNIGAGLAALAARIHPEIGRSATTTVATEWALGWLQTHSGWLLVLDNVEDVRDIEPLLGQLASGHILITSRRGNWHRLATPIKLEVLAPEAAVDLLLQVTRQTGADARQAAGEIAAELGHLPLALEQAAAYVTETGIGLARYLELLRERPARMFAAVPGTGDAQRTIARVWDITLSAIEARNPTAVRLLNVLAWYAPEDIPRAAIAPDEDGADIDEALGLLASYSMIDRTEGFVVVHRLVQAVLLNRQPDREHDEPEARDTALAWLVEVIPNDPQSNVAGWPLLRDLTPHIETVAQHYSDDAEPELLGLLLNQFAVFLSSQAAHLQALGYGKRALAVGEAALGPDHPDMATALGNLAVTYWALGRVGEALPLAERALAVTEAALGPDHPVVAIRLGNLAVTYKELGRAGEALRLEERALAVTEAALGPDHPDVATALGNLAVTYWDLGVRGRRCRWRSGRWRSRRRRWAPTIHVWQFG